MIRSWRTVASLALVLAAASMALSAFLFSNLHDVAVAGCDRQNTLRHELNVTLVTFRQSPRFDRIDCTKAYSLRLPF